MLELCRRNLKPHLGGSTLRSANAGLLLRRGLTEYEAAQSEADGSKGGGKKQALIAKIAGIEPCKLYKTAFDRWEKAIASNGMRFVRFRADLIGRLYIGLSRENGLETGISVHHAYGMPLIPGSAVKGLARSIARTMLKQHADAITWLFGNEHDVDDPEAQEAGSIVFHDAWWIPDDKPFVEEIVTPHHSGYYAEGKAPATDFDSPIPAPQIAARGSFLFVLEGEPRWCNLARDLLEHGLQERGIGAKTTSGYGLFEPADS